MSRETLAPILDAGEEAGCLNLSEFSAAVAGSGAGGGGARGALRRARGARHHPLRRLRPRDGSRAPRTSTATLRTRRPTRSALPQRSRPLCAPDRRRGGRAREEDRGRRRRGEEPDDQLEPPPGRLDREEVPGPRALAARPDPGGRDRPDPRGREVRLAAGIQVLDLRHVVDPPGGPARRREQVAHDPDPRPHRRPRAEDRPRRARADRSSSAGRRRTRRSARRRRSRSSTCARCARPRAR